MARVAPTLMAHARDAARSYGKSDPIDALAVARAALRHPDLPTAHLEGPGREPRLLVDHRDNLVAERTRVINRLRWHLHELDPSWDPRTLTRDVTLDAVWARLQSFEGLVARIARDLVTRVRSRSEQERAPTKEISGRVEVLAPHLLAIPGVAHLCGHDRGRGDRRASLLLQRRLRPPQRHGPGPSGLPIRIATV